MAQIPWSQKPQSFAEIIELIQHYIRDEILRETEAKQLYYHNLDHACAVERRATRIFQAIAPALTTQYSATELSRMESLTSLCGLAHDMVQIFELTLPQQSRRRKSGLSEQLSAKKLIEYIQKLNQTLADESLAPEFLIGDREQQIIQDGIMATVCIPAPQSQNSEHHFSSRSLYQPYLYDRQSKISIIGAIVALADLGTLGMEGAEAYISDGIQIFFEDNPHLYDLRLNCHLDEDVRTDIDIVSEKLLAMAEFIVDLARERQTRFELEIAGFPTQIRQILRSQVFVYLNSDSIDRVQNLVPSRSSASRSELVDFFCRNHNSQIK